MKLTFRWYGEKDCIPLHYIKQIQGMAGVVTAVYDVPVGEVWELSKLERLKSLCEGAGLEMEVIESIPVHEDMIPIFTKTDIRPPRAMWISIR